MLRVRFTLSYRSAVYLLENEGPLFIVKEVMPSKVNVFLAFIEMIMSTYYKFMITLLIPKACTYMNIYIYVCMYLILKFNFQF